MKFSFKSKVDINQDLQIVVPNKDIQEQVLIKLKAAQKDSKLKGFRKGKAPMDVVESIYGPEIRQDVLWDLASKTFSKIAQEKDLKIVSRPNLIPEKIEEGKDAKFKATFEVYPEVSLSKMSKISYTNFSSEISDDDLDKTITNLQKRMSQWETSNDSSKDGDQVKISFVGKIDGEEFEGGTAEDFTVEIGSKSMIEGFEEGLIGLSAGDNKILELTFPDDYGKSDLASKPVNFETQVKEVLSPKLPELNAEFFKSTGIESDDIESFKKDALESYKLCKQSSKKFVQKEVLVHPVEESELQDPIVKKLFDGRFYWHIITIIRGNKETKSNMKLYSNAFFEVYNADKSSNNEDALVKAPGAASTTDKETGDGNSSGSSNGFVSTALT